MFRNLYMVVGALLFREVSFLEEVDEENHELVFVVCYRWDQVDALEKRWFYWFKEVHEVKNGWSWRLPSRLRRR